MVIFDYFENHLKFQTPNHEWIMNDSKANEKLSYIKNRIVTRHFNQSVEVSHADIFLPRNQLTRNCWQNYVMTYVWSIKQNFQKCTKYLTKF